MATDLSIEIDSPGPDHTLITYRNDDISPLSSVELDKDCKLVDQGITSIVLSYATASQSNYNRGKFLILSMAGRSQRNGGCRLIALHRPP